MKELGKRECRGCVKGAAYFVCIMNCIRERKREKERERERKRERERD